MEGAVMCCGMEAVIRPVEQTVMRCDTRCMFGRVERAVMSRAIRTVIPCAMRAVIGRVERAALP